MQKIEKESLAEAEENKNTILNWKNHFFQKWKLKNKKSKIVIVFLTIMIFFGGAYLLVNAQEIVDSFTSTSRIDDSWNVEVDTTAGEVKLEAKNCDDGTWFCSANNICPSTLGDGDYIVVARTDIGSTQQYKDINTACDQPQCSQDGAQSNDSLVADNTINFANYPARQACKNLGGRMPTLTELSCIYTNKVSFGNNFDTGAYWSAMEYSSSINANKVSFSDGSVHDDSKSSYYSVRCVVGW